MERSKIISKLLKEGISEKVLMNFSDNQIKALHNRFISENTKMIPKEKVNDIETAKKNKETFMTYEEQLKGGQKKLDKNHNGKLDREDFKILRSKKTKGKVKRTKDQVDIKEWVLGLAENNFHSFTSKGEIVNMIKNKLHEQEYGKNVKRGHNNVPEFMTYDAIVSSGEEVETPTKPKTVPGTKPERLPIRRRIHRPDDDEETKPKASKREGKSKEVETPTKPKTTPSTKPEKLPIRRRIHRPDDDEETKPKASIKESPKKVVKLNIKKNKK